MERKRSAVRHKSEQPVANSGSVLKGPTPPLTAGRKPEASSPHLQPKSWAGCGAASPAESAGREAPALTLDDLSASQLREFFELLDRWDKEELHAVSL